MSEASSSDSSGSRFKNAIVKSVKMLVGTPNVLLSYIKPSDTHFVTSMCVLLLTVEVSRGVYNFKKHYSIYSKGQRRDRKQNMEKISYTNATLEKGLTGTSGDEDAPLTEGAVPESDEDEEDLRPTPEMLIHYWKQLEKAILVAPRVAPTMPLPEVAPGELPPHFTNKDPYLQKSHQTPGPCSILLEVYPPRLSLPVTGCFMYREEPNSAQLGKWSVSGETLVESSGPVSPAPASAGGSTGNMFPMSPGRGEPNLKWEALFLSWTGIVDFSVAVREVRKLIVCAAPPAFLTSAMTEKGSQGPTEFDTSSANLAVMWYLTNIKAVYEALVIEKNIGRCEEEIEEILSFRRGIYNKCIMRWPSAEEMTRTYEHALGSKLVKLVASVNSCWAVLDKVFLELLNVQKQMRIASLHSLARYLYASSKSKYISAALIAALTAVSSYTDSIGRALRASINALLIENQHDSVNDNRGESKHIFFKDANQALALISVELGRLVLSYVLTSTTSQFISLTAMQRRETVSSQLYEALVHTPMEFFDKHDFNDIEEIMYYVDDMEGIDVQVHNFLFSSVTTIVQLHHTLPCMGGPIILLALTTAFVPRAIKTAADLIKHHYETLGKNGYLNWIGQWENNNNEDEDTFARDGMWLRGIEIIAAVRQLRPYGADLRLTHWWNQHTEKNRDSSFDGPNYIIGALRALSKLPWGQTIAATGSGLLQLANWLLPLFTSALGSHLVGVNHLNIIELADATDAIEKTFEIFTSANEVLDMILHNAHKTSRLENVLSPTKFESTSAPERRYLRNYVTSRLACFNTAAGANIHELTYDYGEDSELRPTMQKRLDKCDSEEKVCSGNESGRARADVSPYLDFMFHRSYSLRAIKCNRLQFSYPVSHSVGEEALPRPFSAEILLQNDSGEGQFVCITGPPSSGKSTVVSLLLSLYASYYSATSNKNQTPLLSSLPGASTTPVTTPTFDNAQETESFPIPMEFTFCRRARKLTYKASRDANSFSKLSLDTDLSRLHSRQARSLLSLSELNNPFNDELDHRRVEGKGSSQQQQQHNNSSNNPYPHFHPRSNVHSVNDNGDKKNLCPTVTVDARDVPVDILRGCIFSYVPQEPLLFEGATIAQNVSLMGYVSVASDSILRKVERCIQLAGCDFIEHLPQGLLTRVCQVNSDWSSSSVSPAERRAVVRLNVEQIQRLMMARAFYQRGDILLMDEPTSHLDDSTTRQYIVQWKGLLRSGRLKGVICFSNNHLILESADTIISI